MHSRSKHIEIMHHFLRGHIVNGVRVYGFQLEGGEWFKGGFRKLFRIE